jgi:excisionase family DNA binding protein
VPCRFHAWSAREVAEILNASQSTIQQLVSHGELAFIQIGRGTERKRMAFTPSEIESFIRRKGERMNYSSGPKTSHPSGLAGENGFMAMRQARIDARAKK